MRSECPGDRLDAAIDAAARSLTAAEPSPALRAVVRERTGRRQRAAWLVPATAVAAVLVVALVGHTVSGPSALGRVKMPELPAKPTPPVLVTVPTVDAGSWELRPVVAMPVLSAPPAMDLAEAPPAPEPVIPPIAIEPLETRQIAADTSSGVMPIEIEPLQIEPLQGE